MQLLSRINEKTRGLQEETHKHIHAHACAIQKIVTVEGVNGCASIYQEIRVFLLRSNRDERLPVTKEQRRKSKESNAKRKQNCKINRARRTISRLPERCICFAIKSDSYRLFPM